MAKDHKKKPYVRENQEAIVRQCGMDLHKSTFDSDDEGEGSVSGEVASNKSTASMSMVPMIAELSEEFLCNLINMEENEREESRDERRGKVKLRDFADENELLDHIKQNPGLLGLNQDDQKDANLTSDLLQKLSDDRGLRKMLFDEYNHGKELIEVLAQDSESRSKSIESMKALGSIPAPTRGALFDRQSGIHADKEGSEVRRNAVDLIDQLGFVPGASMVSPLLKRMIGGSKEGSIGDMFKGITSKIGGNKNKKRQHPKAHLETSSSFLNTDTVRSFSISIGFSMLIGGSATVIPSIFLPPVIPMFITYMVLSRIPGLDGPFKLGSRTGDNKENPGTLNNPLVPETGAMHGTQVLYDPEDPVINTNSCLHKCRRDLINWYEQNPNVKDIIGIIQGRDLDTEFGDPMRQSDITVPDRAQQDEPKYRGGR